MFWRLYYGPLGLLTLMAGALLAADPADLVLRGGRIVCVDADFRVASALAVRDGTIVAIGDAQAVDGLVTSETQVVDLQGRTVLPGLIDSHTHPTAASLFEAHHEIPPMDSIADVLAYVRGRAAVVPKGEWIKLSQVFITRLREQRYPTRAELDAAAPDHPVFFRTGPDGSANSLALAENGIDKAFAAAHPEHVLVDRETGEPNGILRKAATVLQTKPNSLERELTEAERDARLVALLRDYAKVGLTGILDRNCSASSRLQYERLLREGKLPLRVRLSRSLSPRGDLKQIKTALDAIAADPLCVSPHPRLGVIGVKCFQDGGMLTGSAFFSRPWGKSRIYGIDDPTYRGMQYIEPERMEEIVRACVARNLAFTAHCQGDAAVEALLDVYARVGRDQPLARTHSTVTHSSFMSGRAIRLAAELDIGVDLQPAWLYLDARTLLAQFGTARLRHFIPLRSLLDAGVKAGGGSDHMQKIGSLRSVNPYNPFLGMWIAISRSARWHDAPVHPEEALSREQVIRFYTINNAWILRMEDQIGSLEVGKRADFIVLDRDLLHCDLDDVRSTKVLSTWVDGVRVGPAP